MDDFAYRWPYPVFCNPTANGGYDQEVNWQCYNAISVGNVKHNNFSTYVMNGCTQAIISGTCLWNTYQWCCR